MMCNHVMGKRGRIESELGKGKGNKAGEERRVVRPSIGVLHSRSTLYQGAGKRVT